MPQSALSTAATDFIAAADIPRLLAAAPPTGAELQDILDRCLAKECLDVAATARLLAVRDTQQRRHIQDAARQLKHQVYGNRIVLFAPLYIGNHCVNDCHYCGFRSSNRDVTRITLDAASIEAQVKALENVGHKRLIVVFGEHPRYDADFIARTVEQVYAVHAGPHGAIRRVNINAAPLDQSGYARVHAAGIGTYQVFQETYHRPTYERVHPQGTRKGDYAWRLDALARAMQAGVDDVGIGALFGLADWRYEVLGLVAHACHLQRHFGVGPHTISFPRLQAAHGATIDGRHLVSDDDFAHLVAVLRLAVPYTGLILTARENKAVRNRVMAFGVSQIDGGTRIDLGGYSTAAGDQDLTREQFHIGDERDLDTVIRELIEAGYLPSFCTACYRLGRTGEHFMEFAVPGFIKRYCTPNACTTLQEYLLDYASPHTRAAGEALIAQEVAALPDHARRAKLQEYLNAITSGTARDCIF